MTKIFHNYEKSWFFSISISETFNMKKKKLKLIWVFIVFFNIGKVFPMEKIYLSLFEYITKSATISNRIFDEIDASLGRSLNWLSECKIPCTKIKPFLQFGDQKIKDIYNKLVQEESKESDQNFSFPDLYNWGEPTPKIILEPGFFDKNGLFRRAVFLANKNDNRLDHPKINTPENA